VGDETVTLLAETPARLIGGAAAAIALTATVSILIVRHALRRLLDVPRIPRSRAIYYLLAAAWGLLVTCAAATAMAALLLRDLRPLDGRTAIGEVTCQATAPGHLRAEVTLRAPVAAAPERYDIQGEACVVSVLEVELRPGLRALGLDVLARVDGVGALVRPSTNPRWLTPDDRPSARLLGLVVRRTRATPIVVPPDPKQRFVLVAAPGQDPALERI
jgi:hypothetical protein